MNNEQTTTPTTEEVTQPVAELGNTTVLTDPAEALAERIAHIAGKTGCNQALVAWAIAYVEAYQVDRHLIPVPSSA